MRSDSLPIDVEPLDGELSDSALDAIAGLLIDAADREEMDREHDNEE